MENYFKGYDKVISRLKEREKELNCLYQVEELLLSEKNEPDYIFNKLVNILPSAWQFPTACEACITYGLKKYKTELYSETEWSQHADIIVDDNVVGEIKVVYTQLIHETKGNQFLPEEQKLLNTIAQRIAYCLFRKQLRQTMHLLQKKPLEGVNKNELNGILSPDSDEHWKWRINMVEIMANKLDFAKFGVKGLYLIGSVKEATAGPASDIDLLIHIEEDESKKELLKVWFEGWSYCVAETNYLRTGYTCESGLIDLHLITDHDIKEKTSYAVMLESHYNRARPIRLLEK